MTAKGFFTEGEKPFTFGDSLQRKGRDDSSSRLLIEGKKKELIPSFQPSAHSTWRKFEFIKNQKWVLREASQREERRAQRVDLKGRHDFIDATGN